MNAGGIVGSNLLFFVVEWLKCLASKDKYWLLAIYLILIHGLLLVILTLPVV